MLSEPRWLSVETVIEVNRREVAETGEPHAVLHHGLLESAVMRPQQLWAYGEERDTWRLASALLFGIARNHAFQQGNKRTGLTSAVTFLRANGYTLIKRDSPQFAALIIAVIERRISEEVFIKLLRRAIRPLGSPPARLEG